MRHTGITEEPPYHYILERIDCTALCDIGHIYAALDVLAIPVTYKDRKDWRTFNIRTSSEITPDQERDLCDLLKDNKAGFVLQRHQFEI